MRNSLWVCSSLFCFKYGECYSERRVRNESVRGHWRGSDCAPFQKYFEAGRNLIKWVYANSDAEIAMCWSGYWSLPDNRSIESLSPRRSVIITFVKYVDRLTTIRATKLANTYARSRSQIWNLEQEMAFPVWVKCNMILFDFFEWNCLLHF